MAYLEELTVFKEELFRVLTSDEELMRALINVDKPNPLNYQIAKIDGRQHTKPLDYMDIALFDYPWIGTNLETEKKAYITVDMLNTGLSENYYKDLRIAIYVWCHQDVIKMVDQAMTRRLNRIDFILQRIEKLLNQSPNFGIGRLKFDGFRSERMTEEIPGMSITYATMTFDRENKPQERRTNVE